MKDINEEARDRYYKEVGIHLSSAGFTVLAQKDGLLPLAWNGASLCRITAGGGAQYRAEELEPDGANDAFHQATEIAATTADYMRFMEDTMRPTIPMKRSSTRSTGTTSSTLKTPTPIGRSTTEPEMSPVGCPAGRRINV